MPLEEAYVKSTSRAQDLLYTYDAVQRLYDAQIPLPSRTTAREVPGPRAAGAGKYVRLGPLGRAIANAGRGQRSVVLIDEIDKADIDFPNDLLHELDQLAFDVHEVPGVSYAVPTDKPELRPVVIVTNNEEKTLPAAFLRRCVFHYIEFPAAPEALAEILALHGIDNVPLREAAVERPSAATRAGPRRRKPGLSELLNWVGYLQAIGTIPDELASLPYLGALVKQRTDELRTREQQRASTSGDSLPT